MAAILFTACTQDELAEQGNTLPDGEYPLQIGSVNITAEASEEPWTRVSEKPDGSGSVWQPDDAITVSLNGETATYTYDGSAWTSDTPLYWKNTQTAEVTAWYPATDGIVNLSNQDRNGLTYVLRGTGMGNHQSPVTLKFEHQLAKVRVVLSGTQAEKVTGVEVFGSTTSTHNEGSPTAGTTHTKCWEANVVPGAITLSNFIRLNGTTVVTDLTGLPTTLEEGTMYTVNITVGEPVLQDGTTITEAGIYNMQGTYTQGITISNVTVTSYGSYNDHFEDLCAGIGGAGGGACRTITIENATVHAYGAEDEGFAATPAIGSGFPTVAFPTSIPMVTISNHSEVHAHSYWKKESLR